MITKLFIPSIQTSIASDIVKIFFTTAIIIATKLATSADWNNALDASDALNASFIASKEYGEFVNSCIRALSSPPIIDVYPL